MTTQEEAYLKYLREEEAADPWSKMAWILSIIDRLRAQLAEIENERNQHRENRALVEETNAHLRAQLTVLQTDDALHRKYRLANEGELEQLRAHLRALCESGVSFNDPRLRYIEVQIDRGDWRAARALIDLPNFDT